MLARQSAPWAPLQTRLASSRACRRAAFVSPTTASLKASAAAAAAATAAAAAAPAGALPNLWAPIAAATGLSFAAAPPQALWAGGALIVFAVGGLAFAALQNQNGGEAGEAEASGREAPPPREDAVLVFGSTGRMGRTVVQMVSSGPASHT